MKKIKVLFTGCRLKDIYPYATRWEVFKFNVINLFRKLVLVSFAFGMLYGSFKLGQHVFPETVYAVKEVEVESKAIPPILERIAKCESGNKQFLESGHVVRGKVNPSDVGRYQINQIHWEDKARDMGWDILTDEGNTAMALWLYKNQGSEPWASSKKCWNK